MRVFFDLGHPCHVHIFRHLISLLKSEGHGVLVTARKKDVTFQLLEHYGITYHPLPWSGGGIIKKIAYLFPQEFQILKLMRSFNPDVAVSEGSVQLGHASMIRGIPYVFLTDTDMALEKLGFQFRFITDYIITPASLNTPYDYGDKHIRYNGSQELAYLHPKRFSPNPEVLKKYGLRKGEKYFFVRLVSWGAWHDRSEDRVFSLSEWREVIKRLAENGKVFISSEGKLPKGFEEYRTTISPEDALDLLAFATMFLGEGASMASEAAVMGVPSIYANRIMAGIIKEEIKHGLVYWPSDINEGFRVIEEILSGGIDYKERRDRFLEGKVDLTDFLYRFLMERFGKENNGH